MIKIKKGDDIIKEFESQGSLAFWASVYVPGLEKSEWKLWQRVNGLLKDGVFEVNQIKAFLENHFEYTWLES